MEILMKRYPLVASLSLIIPTAECFVVFGCARSSAPQIRNGGCCSGRRLHHADGYLTPSEAPGGKLTSLIHIGADERRTLVYGSGLIASSRVREAGMQLLATVDDQKEDYRMNGGEGQYVEEDERSMADIGGVDEGQWIRASGEALDQKKEAVSMEDFEATYLGDIKGEDGDSLEGLDEDDRTAMGLAPDADDGEYEGSEDGIYNKGMTEEGKKGENQGVTGASVEKEDEIAGKSDYFISISDKDFFSDLAPIEEYQPTDFPDDAMYSREELVSANLSCAQNPFDYSSFYVDRDIKVGNIDEKKREAIQPMMRVVEQVCELIDTTDDVFSFKYTGLIVNKRGIEAWTKKLVQDCYPEAKDVKLVTNRTRDKRDY